MAVRDLARALGFRRPVRLGSFRRLTPISDHWGFDRGQPIDRYYIDRFLEEHAGDIRGRVLEVKDSHYSKSFGSGRTSLDVLDSDASNPDATLVGDLSDPEALPEAAFDCFILTQTLHLIYPFEAAVRGSHRLLRDGGVLLATVPAVSRIDAKSGLDGDFWRFTPASCRRLFGSVFGEGAAEVCAYGNVFAASCFLMGLAREDVSNAELDVRDEAFPVVVAIRAVKS